MAVTEQELQRKFELFNGENLDAIVSLFAYDAVYNQINSGQVATTHGQIRRVMVTWKSCFTGAQIGEFRTRPAVDQVATVPEATQCFIVDFVGHGRYDQTLPGLEDVAPANNRRVKLLLREVVWLGPDDLFARVDNTMVDISPLLP